MIMQMFSLWKIKNSLENKISNFEKQTSNEIAVVIIPSLDGDVVENVAQNIFTKWGIGKKIKITAFCFLLLWMNVKLAFILVTELKGI